MSRLGDWLTGRDIEQKALTATPEVGQAIDGGWTPWPKLGGTNVDSQQIREAFMQIQSASYAYLYSRQPAVRTVVDYVASNVSQLGLKLYERVDDTEREQRGDHPAARTLRNPNDLTTGSDFVYSVVADYLVFHNAYILKLRPTQRGDRMALVTLPPHMVGVIGQNRFAVDAYRVYSPNGTYTDFQPGDIIHWRGYNPDDPRIGVSRLETLRMLLAEEAVSQATNVELLKAGLQSGYIKRPLDAPEWSNEARSRFEADWANRTRRKNRNPVLEEGMEFVPAGLSPKDAEMLAGRRFTLESVAKLYGLPTVPAGTEEERRQFYADVLPPVTDSLAATLDRGLLRAEYGEESFYFEFNLDEKLRGNVEEKMAKLVSAAGAPFLLRDEVRAMQNLPPLPDGQGQEIITPLNVTEGGKPSPQVMPVQDPNGPPQDGSHRDPNKNPSLVLDPPQIERLSGDKVESKAVLMARREKQRDRRDRYASEMRKLLARHFARQENTAKRKSVKALDDDKWDRELGEDLQTAMLSLLEREGGIAAARLGLADFDLDRVKAYVEEAAGSRAHAINTATQRAIDEKLHEDVFEHAKTVRAEEGGMILATAMAAFAHREAAKQAPDAGQRTKTWVVTSGNSRHPQLNGETVPLYSAFSNGLQYPGDGSGDSSAGCQCVLEVG